MPKMWNPFETRFGHPCYGSVFTNKTDHGTADPKATWWTKELLQDLYRLPPNRCLIGQHLGSHEPAGFDSTFDRHVDQFAAKTGGLVPALLSVDFDPNAELAAVTDRLVKSHTSAKKFFPAGRTCGIVSVNWHPAHPWLVDGDAWSKEPVGTAAELIDSSSTPGGRWKSELDRIATGLERLQQARVPVLFRPLHEMNGNWFWWNRVKPFKVVWDHMFEYLTKHRGLHNLLWVHSPVVGHPDVATAVDDPAFYPGDGKVDIVALDAYSTLQDDYVDQHLIESYDALLKKGKPFGFSEYGAPLDDPMALASDVNQRFDQGAWAEMLAKDFPRAVFAIAWMTSDPGTGTHFWSLADTKNFKVYMEHAVTRSRKWLPVK